MLTNVIICGIVFFGTDSADYNFAKDGVPGAQIDLLINRGDGITDICEIKFSNEEYTITSEYMEKLLQKKSVYQTVTKTQNAVHLVMITTFGLARNAHYGEIQNEVTAEDLFK
ncbi:MAG: hypothetical protein J6U21_10920 [Bacteroidales bacterium]|nr:hypothetical protein [Bacteroidales bacterium]